ncbi:hypothetical protein JKP88DRAFT_347374 [Tribonema minus]|uniref:RanBP2-type domain-containing protein n=1 Tax=Tribonema minus TaxID=303371 RepID=A0A836CMD4_9STRA|nr:hypothetical protein JKP88DRAFT_347374 [Tribonema minus]
MANDGQAGEEGWSCEACTYHNTVSMPACEMCGTPAPAAAGGGGSGGAAAAAPPATPGYWSCGACTIQNVSGTYTCYMCGTRLAADGHFSLATYLTELCQELAIGVAHAESGMGRPTVDAGYIRVLVGIVGARDAAAARSRSQEAPLLACRALNYFLTLGASYAAEVGDRGGLGALLHCLSLACTGDTTSLQELAQEAVKGVDLLVRSSADNLRRLLEGGQGLRIVCSFIASAYRKRGRVVRMDSRDGPGVDDGSAAGAPPSSATEAAVARGLELLRLLLETSWHRRGASATLNAVSADEVEAVMDALCAALRNGRGDNKDAALQLLATRVAPRLSPSPSHTRPPPGQEGDGGAAGALGVLLLDEGLLVAAIRQRSAGDLACHLQALSLVTQLLSGSPELCSLALAPSCSLLPVLLSMLEDGGDAQHEPPPSARDRSISIGMPAAAVGVGRSISIGTPGGVSPTTPGSARSGASGARMGSAKGGGLSPATAETLALSNLAMLRIVGLLSHVLTTGRLPPHKSLAGPVAGGRGGAGGAALMEVLVAPARRHGGGGQGGARSERRATLLADLGDGTCLVRYATAPPATRSSSSSGTPRTPPPTSTAGDSAGPLPPPAPPSHALEEIIDAHRVILGPASASFAARARRSLTRALLSDFGPPGGGGAGGRRRGGDGEGDGGDDALGELLLGGRGGLLAGAQAMQQRFLQQFVEGGNVSLVRRVLADGADANGGEGGGAAGAPLIAAAGHRQNGGEGGAAASAPLIAAAGHRQGTGRDGRTAAGAPLIAAAGHRQADVALELVNLLLENGADPMLSLPTGTALHAAAAAGHEDAGTALHAAAAAGHEEGTALHAAAAAGHEEVVAALLDAGADPNSTNAEGATPMDVCSEESILARLSESIEAMENEGDEEEEEGEEGEGEGEEGKGDTRDGSAGAPEERGKGKGTRGTAMARPQGDEGEGEGEADTWDGDGASAAMKSVGDGGAHGGPRSAAAMESVSDGGAHGGPRSVGSPRTWDGGGDAGDGSSLGDSESIGTVGSSRQLPSLVDDKTTLACVQRIFVRALCVGLGCSVTPLCIAARCSGGAGAGAATSLSSTVCKAWLAVLAKLLATLLAQTGGDGSGADAAVVRAGGDGSGADAAVVRVVLCEGPCVDAAVSFMEALLSGGGGAGASDDGLIARALDTLQVLVRECGAVYAEPLQRRGVLYR